MNFREKIFEVYENGERVSFITGAEKIGEDLKKRLDLLQINQHCVHPDYYKGACITYRRVEKIGLKIIPSFRDIKL